MRRRIPPVSRGLPLIFFALALVGLVWFLVFVVREEDPAGETGPAEEIVFDWSEDACEPEDIPDSPTQAFRDAQGRVQLLLSHFVNRRMIGADLDHLDHPCSVVLRSGNDPRPSEFDDREWISSLYTQDGETVVALVHHEYQGHRHPGMCPSGEYRDCWYNAITLAVSSDGGDTFRHASPPRHLVASLPVGYDAGEGPTGLFSPSNIVRHPADGFYYVLTRLIAGDGTRGTCVLRTRTPDDPESWRAWGGHDFDVAFVDPYRSPLAGARARLCAPVAKREIQEMTESLTYNTFFDRFLLIGTAVMEDRETGRLEGGVYFSLSDDLVHWTRRKLIMRTVTPSTYRCGDPDPIAYPSLIDADSPSRTFATSDNRGYLYFTRFNYENCRQTLDRDLIRVPIEFKK